ncbi:DNA polymerase III subunit gamma/tau [Fuchsiella alkaliacetigena]|uniref:DNA polymerase III subunit gamma/tau n=1 Tax=Fuchsiella alkaliacetigena TaxID=957042 RepID=UPI00200AD151|nr:DNA polymerase III subunit gamma/tau [Fuchsiella alkaliacetigena]MCK8824513.1 DNA polymerase III subunit gamma/tau [Fuchsiella alkaliacetigena]
MSYLSLYRKWRPRNFEDIVGQDNIIKTLRNAIKLERIAHAYLFCGPRGTGKTSTAKVLAKALNCNDSLNTNPCGECEICHKIHNNSSVDIIEIDAASNRGIDEIRNLREKVKFSPTEGRYKVYIIDEAHMLTKEAFNALLKTLEEPPEYVIFILATTEPYALLPTILSRCQKFDFGRLSTQDIVERLNFICQQENIELSTEAAMLIARSAEGGMRDAISTLDQLISYSESKIELSDVNEVLGLVEQEVLFEMGKIILNKEVDKGLKLINRILNEGKDLQQFVNSLINYLRSLLVQSECQELTELIEYPAAGKEKMKLQAEKFSVRRLMKIINILIELKSELKQNEQPRILLEMGVIKLINSEVESYSESILERINKLEKEITNLKSIQDISDKEGSYNSQVKLKEKQETEVETKASSENQKSQPKEESTSALNIKENWPKVLAHIREHEIRTHAMLKEGKVAAVQDRQIIIEFDKSKSFHKTNVEQKSEIIEKSIKEVLGVKKKVKAVFSGNNNYENKAEQSGKETDRNPKEVKEFKQKESKEQAEKGVEDHSLVKDVLEVFGGEIIKVGK